MRRAGSPSSPAQPASSLRTFGLASRLRATPAPGRCRPSVPSPKGRSTAPNPRFLPPSRRGPGRRLPRSSRAPHLCLSPEPASRCAPGAPLLATSSVLQKRREGRVAPIPHLSRRATRVARALGTLEHLRLEAQEEPLGARARKCSRSPPREMWRGGGWRTGASGSRNRLRGRLPPGPYGVLPGIGPGAGEEEGIVDDTYLEFEEFQ